MLLGIALTPVAWLVILVIVVLGGVAVRRAGAHGWWILAGIAAVLAVTNSAAESHSDALRREVRSALRRVTSRALWSRDRPRDFWHPRRMGFLDGLKADLQKLQVERQRDLVVQLLHRRFDELTLDDLRALLASPLGRGLGSTRVADLLSVGSKTKATTEPPATPKPAKKSKASRAKPRAKKRPARAKRVAAADKDIRADLVAKLQAAAAPLNNRELAAALGADRRIIRRALKALLDDGSIAASGKAPKLRYTTTNRSQKMVREPSAAKASATKKKASRKSAKPTVTGRTIAGRAAYEAAVLLALREVGEQAPLSALIVKTGGSDNQLRNSLHRLIAAGKVDRTGERDRTRYSLRPQPPTT
jgi:hypothetical protein